MKILRNLLITIIGILVTQVGFGSHRHQTESQSWVKPPQTKNQAHRRQAIRGVPNLPVEQYSITQLNQMIEKVKLNIIGLQSLSGLPEYEHIDISAAVYAAQDKLRYLTKHLTKRSNSNSSWSVGQDQQHWNVRNSGPRVQSNRPRVNSTVRKPSHPLDNKEQQTGELPDFSVLDEFFGQLMPGILLLSPYIEPSAIRELFKFYSDQLGSTTFKFLSESVKNFSEPKTPKPEYVRDLIGEEKKVKELLASMWGQNLGLVMKEGNYETKKQLIMGMRHSERIDQTYPRDFVVKGKDIQKCPLYQILKADNRDYLNDPHITPFGITLVAYEATRMRALGYSRKGLTIYCSPLSRCVETAIIAATMLGQKEIIVTTSLLEGSYRGQIERNPDLTYKLPIYESEVQAAISRFFGITIKIKALSQSSDKKTLIDINKEAKVIMKHFISPESKNLLFVGHNDIIPALACELTGGRDQTMGPVGSWFAVERDGDNITTLANSRLFTLKSSQN